MWMDSCEHCGNRHTLAELYCPNTGKLMAERLLPPHTMLEQKYLIDRPVGVGGMGAVFAATHTLLDKKVAIKVMLSADEQAMARLVQEARAASATGHPNIAAVTDMGHTDKGALFVVMEFLEGRTVKALLESKPLSPRRALRLTSQVLAGLDVVHKQGIIHRDLKPDNLMVVRDDEGAEVVKILDFGISKKVGSSSGKLDLTETGLVMGTPLYMSPEQARGDDSIGAASDIYAVGAILYAMVCGRAPHVADTLAALISAKLETSPIPPSRRIDTLSPGLDEVVLKALAVDPAARYPSAAAMRDAVQELLDERAKLARGSNPSLPLVAAASSPNLGDVSTLDSLDSMDLGSLELMALDEASSAELAAPKEQTRGQEAPLDPSAAGLQPRATTSDRALPRPPTGMAPRELDLEPAAGESPLELADPMATQRGQERGGSEGRRVGGFPAEGAVVGVVDTGRARRSSGVSRRLLWLLVLAALGAGGYYGYQHYQGARLGSEVMVSIEVTPKDATIEVDGVRVTLQPLILKRSKRRFELVVRANGYQTYRDSFEAVADQALHVDLVAQAPPKPKRRLRRKRRRKHKKRRRKSKRRAVKSGAETAS